MKISGRTRLFGLIGHPARRSLSPEMHTRLFEQIGLDAVYLAFDVNPGRADKVAEAIRTLDLVGVNLTVPFKERVIPFLDSLTPAAEECGAVNVITNVDGHLSGYNTDGAGLVASLADEHGFEPAGARCAVLGAGGTGRAVAASLLAAGAARVRLLNRHPERAALVRGVEPGPLEPAAFEGPYDLVVSCLSEASPVLDALPLGALAPGAIWVDVNYWMAEPPRLKDLAERGFRVSNGLGMLLHQGALSFELFTGWPVAPAELRRALEG